MAYHTGKLRIAGHHSGVSDMNEDAQPLTTLTKIISVLLPQEWTVTFFLREASTKKEANAVSLVVPLTPTYKSVYKFKLIITGTATRNTFTMSRNDATLNNHHCWR